MSSYFEQVPTGELIDMEDMLLLGAEDVGRLAAEYQDRMQRFYADVFGLIASVDGLEQKLHAAAEDDSGIFLIYQHVDEAQEGPVLVEPRKDTLLMVASKVAQNNYPIVRIITNEGYTFDDGLEFYVRDVTVDHDGDAILNVGSFPVRNSEHNVPPTAPVFAYANEEHTLGIASTCDGALSTRIQHLEAKDGSHMFPLGHYADYPDRFHALAVAREELDMVRHMQPLFTSLG